MPLPIAPRIPSPTSSPTSSAIASERAPAGARRLSSAVRALDDGTLHWMASAHHGRLEPLLLATARANDVLAPFLATSLWLWRDGRPEARSAVLRGGVATGVAAVVGNAVLKPMVGRQRPDPDRLPPGQRRRSSPSSSALPSGHLTTGTAFAFAAGYDVSRLRPLLAVSAGLAAYTNVYTARHYLSDVVSGMVVGASVGALTRRIPRAWFGRHGSPGARARHIPDRITSPPT